MNFPKFVESSRLLGAIGIASTVLLTGCGSKIVSEGNFGLSKPYFSGTFNRDPLSKGFNFGLLSGIEEFYGREEMLKIDNIQPKDKDSVLLKELDLVITYRVNKENAVAFLVKTSDVTHTDDGVYHLGHQRVDRDAQNTIGQTVRKYSSLELLTKVPEVEIEYKKDLQNDLDNLYGKGTLVVETIKISNIMVSDAIESRIQSIAVINAENAKNEATMKVLANREATLTKEAGVLVSAAKSSGLTVDQLLQYETIKAIRDGVHAQVQVNPKASDPRVNLKP